MGPGSFRLLLSGLVVFSHISKFDIGKTAVIMFFVLSGYWITSVWYKKYSGMNYSYAIFVTSRFLRIYPVYLVVLPLAFLAYSFHTDGNGKTILLSSENIIRNAALFGVTFAPRNALGVSWSLDIEMQFYFLVPIIVFSIYIIRNQWCVILLFVLVCIISIYNSVIDPDLQRELIVEYIGFFLAGTLIGHFRYVPSYRAGMISICCSAAMFALPMLIWPQLITKTNSSVSILWSIATAAVAVPFVAWNVRQKSSALDDHAGALSYPLYLVHYPLISIAFSFWQGAEAKLIGVVASILAALFLTSYVDRPIEIWRRWFVYEWLAGIAKRRTRVPT